MTAEGDDTRDADGADDTADTDGASNANGAADTGNANGAGGTGNANGASGTDDADDTNAGACGKAALGTTAEETRALSIDVAVIGQCPHDTVSPATRRNMG